jgi:glyoxylase-like metal-dependent hydrolase (beta-lactamase superfamily II)
VRVTAHVVGPLEENCYLVVDEATRHAALVDPGAEGERLAAAVRDSGAELQAIWLTHAHMDHVGGIAAVKRAFDVPVYLHPLDRPLYDRAEQAAALYGLRLEAPPAPDYPLAEGDVLTLGALRFAVMHAPGHAPGHVVLHGHGVAFVGDCLFMGSVGRVDLPFSVPQDLTRSLERIAALPEDTLVYAGHGPATSIGRERRTNPFLNGGARVLRG